MIESRFSQPLRFCAGLQTHGAATTLDQYFAEYESWLSQKAFSKHTRRAYQSRLRNFRGFLSQLPDGDRRIVGSPEQRRSLVFDYEQYLKKHLKPASINGALTAIDHFFQFLGVAAVSTLRHYAAPAEPRTLTLEEQQAFLTAADACRNTRDRAIAKLLLFGGLKIGQCAALNLQDISIAGGRIDCNVSGGGNRLSCVQLPVAVVDELVAWIYLRQRAFRDTLDPALFLNRKGRRITTAGIDLIVRKIGRQARLDLSAEVLRRTCLSQKS